MADDMPADPLHEILTLLPVKSLMRFQCVCNHGSFVSKTKIRSRPSLVRNHCHGRICLAIDKDVVLMNPSISVGFGYDPKIRDYKVIRTWRSPTYDHVRIEVYTISTNTWREIDTIDEYFAKHFFWGLDVERYLNGYFYWLGGEKYKDNGNNMKYVISSFNISNEIFQKISTPDDFLPHRSYYNNLFSDCHHDNDLLILKSINHMAIPKCQNDAALLFWKDDEILVRCYKGNAYAVASYNIGTQQLD
ncbi:hypothetical protein SLEP1_g4565 [Rubroshorea leprosula]|uniref:F-box protein n=1 Tax=Rubroshorea leprosula TaxID=152421 RepID=A0AAV5HYL7_9ROSI|nr:hypothetical protein SLEP1_g4565 [Rubroshorea leprosula]